MPIDINELLDTISQDDVYKFLSQNDFNGIHSLDEEKLNVSEKNWLRRHRKEIQSDIVFYFISTEKFFSYVYRVVVSLDRVDTIKYRRERYIINSHYKFSRSGHFEKEWKSFLVNTYGKAFVDYYHLKLLEEIEKKRKSLIRELNEYAKDEWKKYQEIIKHNNVSLG